MSARVLAMLAALLVLVAGGPVETGLPRSHVMEGRAQQRGLHKLHDNPIKGRGNFLSAMEWFDGKDPRPSPIPPELLLTDANPADVKRPVAKLGKPRRPQSYDVFSAALVRAYTKVNDPTNQAASKAVHRYTGFLKKHPEYKRLLRRLFSHLDLNGDGMIDSPELEEAIARGLLSSFGATTVKSWDLNYSGGVSWQEFSFGPLFIMKLKNNGPLLATFKRNTPAGSVAASTFFRSLLTSYERHNPAALSLLEVSTTDDDLSSEAIAKLHAHHAASDMLKILTEPEGVLAEVGSTVTAQTKEQMLAQTVERAEMAALAHLGITRAQAEKWGFIDKIKNSIKGAVAKIKTYFKKQAPPARAPKKATAKPKPAAAKPVDPRPVSKFGIPSEADETCVICQYVMQRVEKELQTKVVDDYTAFDDLSRRGTAPTGGIPGLEQVTGRATGSRKRADMLISERGMRSPVRMIKEVLQVILRRVCGASAPKLFKAGCETLWDARARLARAMAMKMDPGSNCQIQQFCGKKTYFSSPNAVHDPLESQKFNNRRGFCGLLGGPNERGEMRKLCPNPNAANKKK